IAVLAVDGDADTLAIITDYPTHQLFGYERIAVPDQAVALKLVPGDEERAEVVCNLVERIVDCPDFRTPGAGRNGCIDQFVMEAGHDHRLLHAICGKRIELTLS